MRSHLKEAEWLCPVKHTSAGAMGIARIVRVREQKQRPNKSVAAGMANADRATVRVEITEKTLVRLLSAGQVCAAEFRCLDGESKQNLRHFCLKSCAKPDMS